MGRITEREKIEMTTRTKTANNLNNDVSQILEDINDEFYRKQHESKTELILKAAEKLESLGLPRRTICAELVEHLRFASKTLIYKVLGPEYKREHENELSTSELNDEKNDIEEDAKKVKEIHGIDDIMQVKISDDPVVKTLTEKLKQMTFERDFYRDEYDKYKRMYEELLNIKTEIES